MGHWTVIFFPTEDQRNSPFEYILGLTPAEQEKITHRLETLSKLELAEWPQLWFHKINDKLYQLTCDSHRLMYCLDSNKIVVLHACKKVGRKTHPRDVKRANINYEGYLKVRGKK